MLHPTLNLEQQAIFNTVSSTVLQRRDGPAGLGESYVVETLLTYVRHQGQITVICGTTAF